jgi:hypothetical protein
VILSKSAYSSNNVKAKHALLALYTHQRAVRLKASLSAFFLPLNGNVACFPVAHRKPVLSRKEKEVHTFQRS